MYTKWLGGTATGNPLSAGNAFSEKKVHTEIPNLADSPR